MDYPLRGAGILHLPRKDPPRKRGLPRGYVGIVATRSLFGSVIVMVCVLLKKFLMLLCVKTSNGRPSSMS
ncbi:hypothetical protein NEOLEDRAFT_1210753 [Neolentinus lepideus HHB14362 ss-1]|uniref:Uncharacterized protein n=1 Tax=Neolentinus lepideus HHB14362 ss-1 TaxID=1314782 RepID=A0A165RKG7_9AGAM|nr:hypothetical protein NEOLEDRAFT_1210753 [Neolentinus lepideus HHB14362 ss-1]